MNWRKWKFCAVLLVIGCMTGIAYSSCLVAEFLNWDDDEYVTRCVEIHQGLTKSGIKWAFSTDQAANWHPVVWLSYMLDVTFFGLDSGAMHCENLCLHLANICLVAVVTRRILKSDNSALAVALIFAIHPQHVEVVAWVSERKELLSTGFGLAAVLYWQKFCTTRRPAHWLASHALLAMSLMSKPMLVTLPFLLAVIERYIDSNETKIKLSAFLVRQLAEKSLMLSIVGVVIWMTVSAQASGHAISDFDRLPVILRTANAANSIAMYLWQSVVPIGLSPFYPHLGEKTQIMPALLIAIVLIIVSERLIRLGSPAMKIGWLWFMGTLVPVLGLVQVGSAARADRYVYFPHIGLFLFVAAFPWRNLPDQINGISLRSYLRILVACFALWFASLTYRQCQFWDNSVALWQRALEVDPENYRASGNLASAYLIAGEKMKGIEEAERAIRFPQNHQNGIVHLTLGTALMQQGNNESALMHLETAVLLSPDNPAAYTNLGVALRNIDRQRSREMLEKSVKMAPDYPEGLANLANDEARSGNIVRAIKLYEHAAGLYPDNKALQQNLEILRSVRANR